MLQQMLHQLAPAFALLPCDRPVHIPEDEPDLPQVRAS